MLTLLFPSKRDRSIALPVIGSQLILGTCLFLLPVLVQTLAEHAGISVRTAGLLLSMELATAALTTIGLSITFPRFKTSWAKSGGVMAILATVLTLVSPALPVLIISRFLAGAGAGIVGAGATRALSRAVDREKLIAVVTIVSIVDAAVWLAVLPFLIDAFGYRAPYLCLLVVYLAGTALLIRIPRMGGESRKSSSGAATPNSVSSMLVVFAVFLTQLGQGAFWSMEETFGSNARFNSHAIGMVLSIATLILLLGAVGAAVTGERYGRFPTLLILLFVNTLSIFLVGTIPHPWVYVTANILQSLTNLSAVIYQLGLSASLDRTGRTVAACTALVTLGNGVGPGVSASFSGAFGETAVSALVLGLNVAAIALYCVVMMRQRTEVEMTPSFS